MYKDVIAEP